MIYYLILFYFIYKIVRKIYFPDSPEERFNNLQNLNGKLQINTKETSETLYKLHKDARKQLPKMIPIFIRALFRSFTQWKPFFQVFSPKDASELYLPVDVEEGMFMHNTILTTESKTIVEFGTSFGISTIYLGAAAKHTKGKVITSEIEPSKVQVAKKNIADAGLSQQVIFLEGDAMKTIEGFFEKEKVTIDFLFLDGWKDLYLPLLKQLQKYFRNGTIIVADNVDMKSEPITKYLEFIRDPSNSYCSTLFNARTEYSIYLK